MMTSAINKVRLFYYFCLVGCSLVCGCSNESSPDSFKIFFQLPGQQVLYGFQKLKEVGPFKFENDSDSAGIIVITDIELSKKFNCSSEFLALKPEGFSIKKLPGRRIAVVSPDQTGAMYGIMDIAEQIQMGKTISGLDVKTVNRGTCFRGIKFNLPWNSYRTDSSLQIHSATVRDLNYWRDFLDMMADNRFNALTLWNLNTSAKRAATRSRTARMSIG